jgi:hypothetical protein
LHTAVIPADPSVAARSEKRAEELASAGYAVLDSDDYGELTAGPDFAAFRARWDDLPLDEAMPAGSTFRQRRFGRLHVELGESGIQVTPRPHEAFVQSAEINPMHMGRARVFAPVPDEALLSPSLHALVSFDVCVASAACGLRAWSVNLHFVRIVARSDVPGQPTPEGRHRDGHRYVGMHLLGRDGCGGGESIVYGPDEQPVIRLTLRQPLDSLIVDDARMWHQVTPVCAVAGHGVRDVLLVDLNGA